jgi:perosamine synthetase
MNKRISIFKLKYEDTFINKFNLLSKKIFKSPSLSEGSFVSTFENKFANFVKANYAVAVTNGTAALEIAFRIIGINNKEVILPTNTFFATIIAIINAGGKPIFCDNKNRFSPEIDITEIKKKITKNTKAVCVVHVGGIVQEGIGDLVKICRDKNIFLIEDAAHAHGSNLNSKLNAGTIGDIGCFSFYPTKVLTTGEGGMLTTNQKDIYLKIKTYKNFGRSKNPLKLNSLGNNFKISEFTALLGILELDRVKERIKKRNQIVMRYYNNLKNNKNYNVLFQKPGNCAYYKCIVLTKVNANKIEKFCKRKNIELTGRVWKFPLHKQKIFKKIVNNKKFVNANYFSQHHICPPNYPEMTLKEVDYVCSILNKF